MLTTDQVPAPAAGTDWRYVVPGQYVENITGIVATLTTDAPPPPPPNPCLAAPANVHASCAFATVFGPPTGYLAVPLAAFNPGAGPWSVECVVRGIQNTSVEGIVICMEPAPAAVAADNLRIVCSAFFSGSIVWGNGATFTVGMGNKPCNIDNWAHLCVTSDGTGAGRVRAYWNGVQTNNFAAGAYALAAPVRSFIGSNTHPAVGGVSFFWLSDWACYHTALSAARVAVHAAAAYNNLATLATAILADTPRAYYKMADAVGSLIAVDSSGNGFNATAGGTLVFGEPGVTNPPNPPLPPFPARTVNLEIAAGSTVVGRYPPVATQLDAHTTRYSWFPTASANIPVPAGDVQTVSIPPLILPAGYTIGTVTDQLDAGDQWSDITVWYDYTYSGGPDGAGITVDYHNRLLVP